MTMLAAVMSGCGGGASDTGTSAPPVVATPATAAPAVAAPRSPAVIPAPAAGGGIVVGDPAEDDDDRRGRRNEREPAAAAPQTSPFAANPAANGAPQAPAGGANPAVAAATGPIAFGVGMREQNGPDEPEVAQPGASPFGAQRANGPEQPRANGPNQSAGGGGSGRRNDRDDDELAVEQRVAAAAAAGGLPGGPNGPLFRGRVGRGEDGDEEGFSGAGGANGAPGEIKRSTAEEVIKSFLALIAAGDNERAGTLVSSRATGLLGKLRQGTATDDDLTAVREVATKHSEMAGRAKGATRLQVSVRGEKKVLVLDVDQPKEGVSSILSMELMAVPRPHRGAGMRRRY